MSSSIDALIPELQQPCRDLIELAGAAGVQPRITSTVRSYSEQVRLYKRYIRGQSAYPAAPPGTSAHEFGYAFDMIVVGAQNQEDLGTVWQSWGGVWHASDNIHFEYPGFVPPSASLGDQLLNLEAQHPFLSAFLPVGATAAPAGGPPDFVSKILHDLGLI